MPSRAWYRRASVASVAVLLAFVGLLGLPACSSVADFGRLRPDLTSDDIHAWVGRRAAAHVGAPVSSYNLTDDERELRDLAFPLIEPSYERQRWDAVLNEYGLKREFERTLWVSDPTAYYIHLQAAMHRSSVARYSQLIDDIRNDIVRLEPFFATARRVVDLDQRRAKSMQYLADVGAPERLNAQARIGENSFTIAWVHHSLAQRCASYRFALDHLVVAEPQAAAAEAERTLIQLQQQIAANELVPAPHFATVSPRLAVQRLPVSK